MPKVGELQNPRIPEDTPGFQQTSTMQSFATNVVKPSILDVYKESINYCCNALLLICLRGSWLRLGLELVTD